MSKRRSLWSKMLTTVGIVNEQRRVPLRCSTRGRLGCFERLEDRRMLANFLVTESHDADVGTPEAVGTLRQAVFDANQFDDGTTDMIIFDSQLNGQPITLGLDEQGNRVFPIFGEELVITDSVTIVGEDANGTPLDITIDASGFDETPTVDNGDGSRVFDVSGAGSPIDVVFENLPITGGEARFDSDGGGVSVTVSGTVTFTNVKFEDNYSEDDGGGLYIDPGGNGE